VGNEIIARVLARILTDGSVHANTARIGDEVRQVQTVLQDAVQHSKERHGTFVIAGERIRIFDRSGDNSLCVAVGNEGAPNKENEGAVESMHDDKSVFFVVMCVCFSLYRSETQIASTRREGHDDAFNALFLSCEFEKKSL
jgi:hypothetical protein